MFDALGGVQTVKSIVVYNIAGTKFIVKTANPEHAAYLKSRADEEEIGYDEYDHAGILAEVVKPSWTPEELFLI